MFTHFYHGSIRKLVTAFGTLFNNVYISRTDGGVTKKIKVPLIYSPKEKFVHRLNLDVDKTMVQTILPRMGFSITSMSYDVERKKNSINKRWKQDIDTNDNITFQYRYEDVPYDIDFELYIYTRNMDDGLQIIEQILPFFTPEFTITIKPKVLNTSSEKVDIPIILNQITPSEIYDNNFSEDTRVLTWDLQFTTKTYLYGPVKEAPNIIKDVNINIFDINESTE
jgi:hypothetical protein